MKIARVNVETLVPPRQYPRTQLEQAIRIARALHRGKLVLTEPPKPQP